VEQQSNLLGCWDTCWSIPAEAGWPASTEAVEDEAEDEPGGSLDPQLQRGGRPGGGSSSSGPSWVRSWADRTQQRLAACADQPAGAGCGCDGQLDEPQLAAGDQQLPAGSDTAGDGRGDRGSEAGQRRRGRALART